MSPIVLATAARVMAPVLILFSLVMLVRGHDAPGGGFVGGLIGASGFVLLALGYGRAQIRKVFRIAPRRLAGAGLLVAVISGAIGLLGGGAFLEGLWLDSIGTPLLFDVGVYGVVFGVTLAFVFKGAED